MWLIGSVILAIWFILKFLLHKGGYVHLLLILSLSMYGVQILADRKTRYHRNAAKDNRQV
jgi:hypothetical protein